ncbi:MAG: NAD kinase [Pseudoclavibacter sp.]
MSLRRILLVIHPRSEVAEHATRVTCGLLQEAGVQPVFVEEGLDHLRDSGFVPEGAGVLGIDCTLEDLELVMVLGGDGTILNAAEIVRPRSVPILGVNLGHVGFLAEAERDDLLLTVQRVVAGEYTVEERLALEIEISHGGRVVGQDWALNDATVEKSRGDKMINVVCAIGGTALSRYACDGIVMSTPTGSTAYNFSAGGPVVWPDVEALLFVPLNAHALFSRPLVISPDSDIAIQVSADSEGADVWCDGRRLTHVPAGARIVGRRSRRPVRLARLNQATFVSRLVHKFDLPTNGWRDHDAGANPTSS